MKEDTVKINGDRKRNKIKKKVIVDRHVFIANLLFIFMYFFFLKKTHYHFFSFFLSRKLFTCPSVLHDSLA